MPKNQTLNFDILALFDAVMAEVEPDLMRQNVDSLEVKYKNETKKQRTARAERYAAAYEEWKRRLQKILTTWKGEILQYRDSVLKGVKRESAEKDQDSLLEISSAIDTL